MRHNQSNPLATVLIADDEPVMRLLARESLEQRGFRVEEVSDGSQVLAAFERHCPEIVLLDVQMPIEDGFSACLKLRKTATGRHVPILMVTGQDDLQSIQQAYEAGATDFVAKPINWVILGHRVEYMLRASRAAEDLRQSRTRLENAQRIASLGYWEWIPDSGELNCSNELYRILDLDPDERLTTMADLLERVHPEDERVAKDAISNALIGQPSRNLEFRLMRPDASVRHVEQQTEPAFDENDTVARIDGIVRDVSARRDAEEKIRYLAYYDGLTGLPNRRAFLERLELALSISRRRKGTMALLFLDLDRFKRINDTLGHQVGDSILQQVTEKLLSCVRATDMVGRPSSGEPVAVDLVSRFGGDEFVILLADISSSQDATHVARRLAQVLATPFSSGNNTIQLTASIGIAVSPTDGTDGDTLVNNAHAAMSHSKERGGSNYQFFTDSMNEKALERMALESSLNRAIEQNEFVLYYQPQFDMEHKTIVGAEALIRWQDPENGLIEPAKFIPLAEETGQIVPIGNWVLRTALRQVREWKDEGLPNLRMAINVSGKQFGHGEFPKTVSAALEEHLVDPSGIDLELTESTLMQDESGTIASLEALKELGVQLSVDDFGTGYSSLNYLTRLPLDALKIDRSFLIGTPDDSRNVGITRAIIALAKNFDLQVTAEGVEYEKQLEFLRLEGCFKFQGFLFSKPIPAQEFASLVREMSDMAASDEATENLRSA